MTDFDMHFTFNVFGWHSSVNELFKKGHKNTNVQI